jgi:hypothetical protein
MTIKISSVVTPTFQTVPLLNQATAINTTFAYPLPALTNFAIATDLLSEYRNAAVQQAQLTPYVSCLIYNRSTNIFEGASSVNEIPGVYDIGLTLKKPSTSAGASTTQCFEFTVIN